MKIHPVGGELFHADRRTDVMKLIVVFRNFANAPKNVPLGAFYRWEHQNCSRTRPSLEEPYRILFKELTGKEKETKKAAFITMFLQRKENTKKKY
jgi:hypothetical protein